MPQVKAAISRAACPPGLHLLQHSSKGPLQHLGCLLYHNPLQGCHSQWVNSAILCLGQPCPQQVTSNDSSLQLQQRTWLGIHH